MSEVLGYQEFMEALDSVNSKAVKKKFKDRKDKDIDNDGDVDASDKYLHKRRKAVSKAVKNEDMMKPMTSAQRAKEMQKKADKVKRDAEAKLKKAKGITMGEKLDSKDKKVVKDVVKALKGATKAHAGQAKELEKAMTTEGKYAKYSDLLLKKQRMKKLGQNTMVVDKEIEAEKKKIQAGGLKTESLDEDAKDVLKRMRQTRDNLKKQGNSAGLAAMELRIKKFKDSMSKESIDEEMPASFKAMLIQRDKMKKLGQNIDAINAKIKKARADAMRMTFNKEESLDEKGPGLYHNINMKRKRGEKMRKKGEKGAPSEKDFASAAKTAREERENCHSKDHDCATVVEHIVWGFGKPIYESHAVPTDDGYVEWYDVEFEHGIEKEVPTEDLKIYTTEAHSAKTLNKGKKIPKAGKSKAEPVDEEDRDPAYERNPNHYKDSARVKSNLAKAKAKMGMGSKYSDSEISRAVDIAKKMAGGNYTGAYKKIEGIKKGLAQQGKVKYALKKAAESFETFNGLTISEVEEIVSNLTDSAQDYIKLVEDGDLESVDEPKVEPVKGMPLSYKQFQSKIGD